MSVCPNCEATGVPERLDAVDVFYYGEGENPVKLTARVPMFECACGLVWTDHRGEAARDEAVLRYLEGAQRRERELR